MSDSGTTKLDQLAKVTQIITALSIIVGIILGIAQLYKTSRDLKESTRIAKLTALPTVKELIREDGDVRTKALNDFGGEWDKQKINQVLAQRRTVAEAYYSDDLKPVRDMGHHYEVLGALVAAEVVDFKIVYEIVDFPDGFWDATEDLRTQAQINWVKEDGKGKGKGLSDFWKNFNKLHGRYVEQRKIDAQEESKKAKS